MSKSKSPTGQNTSLKGESLYKWDCPVCDASNIGTAKKDGPRTHGLQALQSHIRAKKGNGHGPQYAIPEQWSSEKLGQCVEAADQ